MPHDRLPECHDQAARLQRQLIRVSRALQRTCEEAARQHELLASHRRSPAAGDHELWAKQWWTLADQALATARSWEADGALAGSSATVRSGPAVAPVLDGISAAINGFDGASRPHDGIAGLAEWRGREGRQPLADTEFRVPNGLGDVVVRRLFGIGLQLNDLLPQTDGAVRDRIVEALDDVEACLGEIRRVAFTGDDTSARSD